MSSHDTLHRVNFAGKGSKSSSVKTVDCLRPMTLSPLHLVVN